MKFGKQLLKPFFNHILFPVSYFMTFVEYSALKFTFIFRYFPSNGELVHIFVTDMKMPDELRKLDQVITDLENQVRDYS